MRGYSRASAAFQARNSQRGPSTYAGAGSIASISRTQRTRCLVRRGDGSTATGWASDDEVLLPASSRRRARPIARQHVGRGVDPAALFEPRVPGDRHAGEHRHLFATQPRRAPVPAARGSPTCSGETLAARPQKLGELGAMVSSPSSRPQARRRYASQRGLSTAGRRYRDSERCADLDSDARRPAHAGRGRVAVARPRRAADSADGASRGDPRTRSARRPTIVDEPDGPHVHWRAAASRGCCSLGHHDTVFPLGALAAATVRRRRRQATGPGVFDMKGGIVQAIHAIAALDDRIRRRAAVHRRRGDRLRRVPALIEERAAACGACSCSSRAPTAARSRPAARERARSRSSSRGRRRPRRFGAGEGRQRAGRGGPPGADDQHLRAIAAAGTTVTPTVAHAGTADNVVPAEARLRVDVRVTGPDEADGSRRRWRRPAVDPAASRRCTAARTARRCPSRRRPSCSRSHAHVMPGLAGRRRRRRQRRQLHRRPRDPDARRPRRSRRRRPRRPRVPPRRHDARTSRPAGRNLAPLTRRAPVCRREATRHCASGAHNTVSASACAKMQMMTSRRQHLLQPAAASAARVCSTTMSGLVVTAIRTIKDTTIHGHHQIVSPR